MRKIIAGLALFGLGLGTGAAAGLDVTLSAPSARSDYGSGKIAYALTNNSGTTLHVLRWQTPLDGMTGRLFDVTRNGEKIDYVGPIYKRLPPTPADYVALKPGETLATEIDLTAYYDMKSGGQFDVRYVRDARDVVKEVGETAKSGVAAGYLDFDRKAAASIWVDAAVDALDGLGAPGFPDDADGKTDAGARALSSKFVGCSTTQKAQTNEARLVATSYAKDAKAYMDAGKRSSRYAWWFGSYDSSRYTTVRNKFTKIHRKLSSGELVFNCGCVRDDAVAFVWGSDTKEIFLCPPFWPLQVGGEYSKAGTIVHEVSHLRGTAGTEDWAYIDGAHDLALNNPERAVHNAASYEYFSVNALQYD